MPNKIGYHRPITTPSVQIQSRQYNAGRKEDNAFYSTAAWLKVRSLKLAMNPLCESCEANEQVTAADTVHHKEERKKRPDLALDIDNLESVCRKCHGEKRKRS